MNFLTRAAAISSLLLACHAAAAPADGLRVRSRYQSAMDSWSAEMRAAATPQARATALADRPDALPYAQEMWSAIRGSLAEEAVLEPAAWFLRVAPGLRKPDEAGTPQPVFAKETESLLQAIEQHHLKSPKLGPVAYALASNNDPHSLALLQKIQESHPDPKVQGVAALGAAMQLRALGDSPSVMRQRLNSLRKAIIQSADVEMDGTTIAKLAEDELYIINHLTKGRVAPNLVGQDSAGRALTLASRRGKVVVLLFWNSSLPEAARILEITSSLTKKFKDRPLAVLGVNNDPLAKLRDLEADGTVSWPNFSDPDNRLAHEYRVGSWPLVYVLDAEGKIHYSGAPGSFAELTAEALLSETTASE